MGVSGRTWSKGYIYLTRDSYNAADVDAFDFDVRYRALIEDAKRKYKSSMYNSKILTINGENDPKKLNDILQELQSGNFLENLLELVAEHTTKHLERSEAQKELTEVLNDLYSRDKNNKKYSYIDSKDRFTPGSFDLVKIDKFFDLLDSLLQKQSNTELLNFFRLYRKSGLGGRGFKIPDGITSSEVESFLTSINGLLTNTKLSGANYPGYIKEITSKIIGENIGATEMNEAFKQSLGEFNLDQIINNQAMKVKGVSLTPGTSFLRSVGSTLPGGGNIKVDAFGNHILQVSIERDGKTLTILVSLNLTIKQYKNIGLGKFSNQQIHLGDVSLKEVLLAIDVTMLLLDLLVRGYLLNAFARYRTNRGKAILNTPKARNLVAASYVLEWISGKNIVVNEGIDTASLFYVNGKVISVFNLLGLVVKKIVTGDSLRTSFKGYKGVYGENIKEDPEATGQDAHRAAWSRSMKVAEYLGKVKASASLQGNIIEDILKKYR